MSGRFSQFLFVFLTILVSCTVLLQRVYAHYHSEKKIYHHHMHHGGHEHHHDSESDDAQKFTESSVHFIEQIVRVTSDSSTILSYIFIFFVSCSFLGCFCVVSKRRTHRPPPLYESGFLFSLLYYLLLSLTSGQNAPPSVPLS
jgi:hypothetical protein